MAIAQVIELPRASREEYEQSQADSDEWEEVLIPVRRKAGLPDVIPSTKVFPVRDAGITAKGELRDVAAGHVAKAIVETASDRGIDLIVMGSHGRRGFARMFMGSVAEGVLRASSVPVLVVRGPAH